MSSPAKIKLTEGERGMLESLAGSGGLTISGDYAAVVRLEARGLMERYGAMGRYEKYRITKAGRAALAAAEGRTP